MPGARRSCAPTPGPHGAMGNSTRLRASAATAGAPVAAPCGRWGWCPAAWGGRRRRAGEVVGDGRPRAATLAVGGRRRWPSVGDHDGRPRATAMAAGARPRSHRGMIGVARGLDRKDQHGL